MAKSIFARLSVVFWVLLICAGGVFMVVRVQAKLQEAAANTAAMEQKEEVQKWMANVGDCFRH